MEGRVQRGYVTGLEASERFVSCLAKVVVTGTFPHLTDVVINTGTEIQETHLNGTNRDLQEISKVCSVASRSK